MTAERERKLQSALLLLGGYACERCSRPLAPGPVLVCSDPVCRAQHCPYCFGMLRSDPFCSHSLAAWDRYLGSLASWSQPGWRLPPLAGAAYPARLPVENSWRRRAAANLGDLASVLHAYPARAEGQVDEVELCDRLMPAAGIPFVTTEFAVRANWHGAHVRRLWLTPEAPAARVALLLALDRFRRRLPDR
jgi:hypothetical protein